MITVSIRFVDGSMQEFSESADFLSTLTELQNQGYKGKELIHELLSDDWGAPPLSVQIKGTKSDGTKTDINILYN